MISILKVEELQPESECSNALAEIHPPTSENNLPAIKEDDQEEETVVTSDDEHVESISSSKKPKSGPVGKKSNDVLKAWLLSSEHFVHPYPSVEEKKSLQAQTGLTTLQLKNWFTNARRRTWKPIMQGILNDIDLEPILEKGRMQWSVPNVALSGDMMLNLNGTEYKPKKNTGYLKAWLLSSSSFIHPYPNQRDRKILANLSKLSPKQMKDWFTNARRRMWKPLMNKIISKIDLSSILATSASKNLQRKNAKKSALSINQKQFQPALMDFEATSYPQLANLKSDGESLNFKEAHSTGLQSGLPSNYQQRAPFAMTPKSHEEQEAIQALTRLHQDKMTFSNGKSEMDVGVHSKIETPHLLENKNLPAIIPPTLGFYGTGYGFGYPPMYYSYPPMLTMPMSLPFMPYTSPALSYPYTNQFEAKDPIFSSSMNWPNVTQSANDLKPELTGNVSMVRLQQSGAEPNSDSVKDCMEYIELKKKE
eukprot:CAMPEP_0117805900 /NCGR_PEP_ID=MMETSP0948-20121206/18185_1 /TAXON_ID=44440 /ORGANISM="Chattonella subsalsa, Strain CCMP2191" /LENGTH=478 /DNA_ID=CAMNT_0005640147 /DNA_START=42 /DNA_END=1475 /DNA_ORIENTATION=-